MPFAGALNIYSRRPEGFDDSARDLAFLLATHASLALVVAETRQTLADAEDTNDAEDGDLPRLGASPTWRWSARAC